MICTLYPNFPFSVCIFINTLKLIIRILKGIIAINYPIGFSRKDLLLTMWIESKNVVDL